MFRIKNAAGLYYFREMHFGHPLGNPATYVSRANAEKKLRSMRRNISARLDHLRESTETGKYDFSSSLPRWEQMLSEWNGAEVVELTITEKVD